MTEEHEVVIQFRNVTKTFDLFKNDKQRLKSLLFHNTNAKKKVAIDNLSFDIRQGEAVAILGKNGAGKSTMLKMISGVTCWRFPAALTRSFPAGRISISAASCWASAGRS